MTRSFRELLICLGLCVSLCAADDSVVNASTAPPKTVITSRSARVTGKGRFVEFTGDVVLVRGADTLWADRLITEDNNAFARAWGSVRFRRQSFGDPVLWESWGDRAVYDTRLASGTIWGDASVARARRSPEGDPSLRGGVVDVEAPVITLARIATGPVVSDGAAGLAQARGGVYIKSVESTPIARVTEVWSERADYNGPEDRFEVEGVFPRPFAENASDGFPQVLDRPYARQIQGREQRDVEGERIVLHPTAQRVVVERRAKARMRFEQERRD